MLSKIAINDFKKIYLEEYGEQLTDKDAMEKANQLMRLFQTVYKPIKDLTPSKRNA